MRSFCFSRVTGCLLVFTAAVFVACSNSRGYVPPASPSSATSATVTTSTSSTVTLPGVSTAGISVTGTLPVANAAVSVTETISVSAPSGTTPLVKARDADASPSPTPIVYLTFSSSSSVTLSAIPALTFTLPSVTSGDSYYLALDTGSGWQTPVSGPGTVSGNVVTFASATGSVAITPTQPAVFALYAIATQTPTPSPSPTPVASPNSLVFDESSPAPQTFSVSEAGYAGAFTESTSCTASPSPSPVPTSSPFVAEVSPTSATPSAAGAAVSFTVTPGYETGSCTVTVSDSNAATATISVVVGSDQVIIYKRKRQ